ncbi:5481_t:CDS:2 [Ambispora gerdemannii]|uniref:5481_t:CDS:1 n=1 Tax=Ambispora gerdemannii TaxID=144530 RepID=A0A9N9A8U6_9GLOM|nr:5481_t:CDS:2 [Ambispora gerdemannii]
MPLSQIAQETACESSPSSANQFSYNHHSYSYGHHRRDYHVHQSVKPNTCTNNTTKVQRSLGNLNLGLVSSRKQFNHHLVLKKSVNINNSNPKILSANNIKHINSYTLTVDSKEWIHKYRRLASNLLDIFKKGITRGDKDKFLVSAIKKFLRTNESMLGYCHQFNWGTEKDSHQAIKCYMSASKNGNVAASEVLSTLFY